MSILSPQWTLAFAALALSCSAAAQTAERGASRVLTLNLASVDPSSNYQLTPQANESGVSGVDQALSFASTEGITLGFGIEDRGGRFMLEYYYANSDIEAPPFAVTDDTATHRTHTLFYSGYWVPDIYWGLKGILGAGIGYGEQTLTNTQAGDLEDRGWAYKFSGGLEYALLQNLSIYGLIERIYFDDLYDQVSVAGQGDSAAVSSRRQLQDSEQTRMALGINYRF